jgi:hypothetical protein
MHQHPMKVPSANRIHSREEALEATSRGKLINSEVIVCFVQMEHSKQIHGNVVDSKRKLHRAFFNVPYDVDHDVGVEDFADQLVV